MTYQQVVKHFGGVQQAGAALGITHGAVCHWKKTGIPYLRQIQIEKVSGGKLRAGGLTVQAGA